MKSLLISILFGLSITFMLYLCDVYIVSFRFRILIGLIIGLIFNLFFRKFGDNKFSKKNCGSGDVA
jgi:hypothetical protein